MLMCVWVNKDQITLLSWGIGTLNQNKIQSFSHFFLDPLLHCAYSICNASDCQEIIKTC